MLRDRLLDAAALVLVPPYLAGCALLERLNLVHGRGWQPTDTWAWALRTLPTLARIGGGTL